MRLDFLCPHHRLTLLEAPQRAAGVWRDCDRRLRDDTSLPSPTRLGLAGSALEAADIYLSALYLASRSPAERSQPERLQPPPPPPAPGTHLSPSRTVSALSPVGRGASVSRGDDAFILERYAAAALRLMDMLCAEGQRQLALVVLAGANAMVEQVARAGADVHAALRACRRLTQDGMSLLGGREAATERSPAAAAATLH